MQKTEEGKGKRLLKRGLLGSPLIAILLGVTLFSMLNVATITIPVEAYGRDEDKNYISSLTVSQNDSGSWTQKGQWYTSGDGTPVYNPATGFSCQIDTDKWIKFLIVIGVNKTLAPTAQNAQDYTHVNFTLSGSGGIGTIYNNVTMSFSAIYDSTTYWLVSYLKVWNTQLAQSGITYTANFYYFIYY